MSFHGALLGILFGILFISIRDKINFFKLSDFHCSVYSFRITSWKNWKFY